MIGSYFSIGLISLNAVVRVFKWLVRVSINSYLVAMSASIFLIRFIRVLIKVWLSLVRMCASMSSASNTLMWVAHAWWSLLEHQGRLRTEERESKNLFILALAFPFREPELINSSSYS